MEKNYLENIEKSRNTKEQLSFYDEFSSFLENSPLPLLDKFRSFPVYTTRQVITRFLERYELFKLVHQVPGSFIECGVGSGLGLMGLAHLCTIFEPYHYTRRVIGFDTFNGFDFIHEKDIGGKTKADHIKPGGLSFDTYDIITDAIQLFDKNRPLGHIEKIELVKGDILTTFHEYIQNDPSLVIAMLYLDVDLYEPTKCVLEQALPRMPKGAVIVFDELNHVDYPGETIALMEEVGIHNLELKRLAFSTMLGYAVIK